jgi:hypothetical protein
LLGENGGLYEVGVIVVLYWRLTISANSSQGQVWIGNFIPSCIMSKFTEDNGDFSNMKIREVLKAISRYIFLDRHFSDI